MRSGWPLLLLPGLIWGASFLFIAEALRSIEPNGLTFLRILIGFSTLACIGGAHKPVDRAGWTKAAWLGVLWFAFPLSMFPYAEQRVSSAMTGMLNGVNPLFATIVASVLARKAPSSSVNLGLSIGMFGTALIAWPAIREGQSSAFGIALIVAALISYGVALSLARALQLKYGALPVSGAPRAVALAFTAPLGVPELLQARWAPGPLLSSSLLACSAPRSPMS